MKRGQRGSPIRFVEGSTPGEGGGVIKRSDDEGTRILQSVPSLSSGCSAARLQVTLEGPSVKAKTRQCQRRVCAVKVGRVNSVAMLPRPAAALLCFYLVLYSTVHQLVLQY